MSTLVSRRLDEAFRRFEALTNLERGGYKPRLYRLERMRRLLARFGDPHLRIPALHIAGSKGKGSTATYLAAILTASGRRTGLYTSPHVSDYRERFCMDGVFVPDEILDPLADELVTYLDELRVAGSPEAELPTTFEMLTLLAFRAFLVAGCEVVVLETGMGGRLDATNLVDPLASVITPIELEHTEYLGTTIAEIAFEKAGIIKPGRPVFVSRQRPEAMAVFEAACRERGCEMVQLTDELADLDLSVSAEGSRFHLVWRSGGRTSGVTRLIGRVQVENAALAALVSRRIFPEILDAQVETGIASAWLPGRMEVFRRDRPIVIDGAHTPNSVARVAEAVAAAFGKMGVIVFGSVDGKDIAGMLDVLVPLCPRFVVSRPGTFKKSSPEAILRMLQERGVEVTLRLEAADALREARARCPEGSPVLVVGSFYLASEIRRVLMEDLQ